MGKKEREGELKTVKMIKVGKKEREGESEGVKVI